MPKTKTECRVSADQLTPAGLSGKTCTGLNVILHGSVVAIEYVFSGGSSFVKVKDNQRN